MTIIISHNLGILKFTNSVALSILLFFNFFLDASNYSFQQNNNYHLCDSILKTTKDLIETHPEVALKKCQFILKLYQNDSTSRCYLTALRYSGLAYLHLGNRTEALSLLKKAYFISKHIKDSISWSSSASNLFYLYLYYDGNLKMAQKFLNEAYNIDKKLNDMASIAIHLMNYGELEMLKGNYDKALSRFFAAAQIETQLKNFIGIADAYNNITHSLLMLKDTITALKYLHKAYYIYKSYKKSENLALAATNLAYLYVLQKQCEKAQLYINEALNIRKKFTDKKALAQSYFVNARLLQCKGKLSEAEEWFFQGSLLALEANNYYQLATAFYEQGLFHLYLADTTKAIQYFQNSLEFAQNIEYKALIDTINYKLAYLFAEQKNWKKAYEYQLKINNKNDNNEQKNKLMVSYPLNWKLITYTLAIVSVILIIILFTIIFLQDRYIRSKFYKQNE